MMSRGERKKALWIEGPFRERLRPNQIIEPSPWSHFSQNECPCVVRIGRLAENRRAMRRGRCRSERRAALRERSGIGFPSGNQAAHILRRMRPNVEMPPRIKSAEDGSGTAMMLLGLRNSNMNKATALWPSWISKELPVPVEETACLGLLNVESPAAVKPV